MAVTTKQLTPAKKHRGSNFNVYFNPVDNTWSLDTMMVVLLSDIRDELHAINQTLRCSRFVAMPTTLQEIRDALKPPPAPAPKRRRRRP